MTVVSLGIPTAAPVDKRGAGEPFPCQDCPCGCKDAETCWRDCCCFTNQQKLAWAKRHRVQPPAFVVAAAKREGTSRTACHACAGNAAGCGGAKASNLPSCCARRAARQMAAACSEGCCDSTTNLSCGSGGESQCGPPQAPRRGAGAVLLITKLRCSGLSLSVTALPPSLTPAITAIELVMDVRFAPPLNSPSCYLPPYLAVSEPPPDAGRA